MARLLGVSTSTVRRDLNELQERGLIERVHGGAAHISDDVEPLRPLREIAFADEKRRIGQAAAAHVVGQLDGADHRRHDDRGDAAVPRNGERADSAHEQPQRGQSALAVQRHRDHRARRAAAPPGDEPARSPHDRGTRRVRHRPGLHRRLRHRPRDRRDGNQPQRDADRPVAHLIRAGAHPARRPQQAVAAWTRPARADQRDHDAGHRRRRRRRRSSSASVPRG